jgi:hypothetical protein
MTGIAAAGVLVSTITVEPIAACGKIVASMARQVSHNLDGSPSCDPVPEAPLHKGQIELTIVVCIYHSLNKALMSADQ